MSPVPGTAAVLAELERGSGTPGSTDELLARARRVREVVPACVALRLTLIGSGTPLTLVAPDLGPGWLDTASSLTVALRHGGETVGSVDLLVADAADVTDLAGHAEVLGALLGAWAARAAAPSDPTAGTRRTVARVPAVSRGRALLAIAVGVVAERTGVDPAEARRRVEASAGRAGVSPVDFARSLVEAAGQGFDHEDVLDELLDG